MQLASKVLERAGADTGKSIMITFAEKVQLLNSLLASTAPLDTDMYAAATIGVKNALKDAHAASLEDFARRALSLYNPGAKMEFLDFSGGYFDPLFALAPISAAMRRLSGHSAAILIVNGLSDLPAGRRRTRRVNLEKSADFEFVDGQIKKYKKVFPSLEVFFI